MSNHFEIKLWKPSYLPDGTGEAVMLLHIRQTEFGDSPFLFWS